MKENLQAEATKKAYCDKASGLPETTSVVKQMTSSVAP